MTEGSVYAEEARVINGGPERCVLLDSVRSQANRLEHALLDGYRSGVLEFPLVEVDFGGTSVGSWYDLSLMNPSRGRS
jgi:hypothetical protein